MFSTFIKNTVLVFLILSSIQNVHCINARAIGNAGDSVLCGSSEISHFMIVNLLEKISQEETNPKICLSRTEDESTLVIEKACGSIIEKLKTLPTGFDTLEQRVSNFLHVINDIEYINYKIPLSYLVEDVDEKL